MHNCFDNNPCTFTGNTPDTIAASCVPGERARAHLYLPYETTRQWDSSKSNQLQHKTINNVHVSVYACCATKSGEQSAGKDRKGKERLRSILDMKWRQRSRCRRPSTLFMQIRRKSPWKIICPLVCVLESVYFRFSVRRFFSPFAIQQLMSSARISYKCSRCSSKYGQNTHLNHKKKITNTKKNKKSNYAESKKYNFNICLCFFYHHIF